MQYSLIEQAGDPGSQRREALVGLGRALRVPHPPHVCRAMPTPNIDKKVLYDIALANRALTSLESEVEWEWGLPLKKTKRRN